mgnify:CR=1 FL=1
MISGLLQNPYQYSGQVIAKMCVNVATIIWSIVVLFKPDALTHWPGPQLSAGIVGENFVAALFIVLASIATARLLIKSTPRALGACVYGAFLLLWLYTLTTLILAIASGVTALRPGQLSGVIVVNALAVFAFVSNPKKTNNEPYAD